MYLLVNLSTGWIAKLYSCTEQMGADAQTHAAEGNVVIIVDDLEDAEEFLELDEEDIEVTE